MEKRLILEKLTLPLDMQTQCFLFNVQLLWSYGDCRKWVILRKTAFYKVPNGTSLFQKNGRINCLAYVPVAVFWRYMAPIKSSITLRRYRAAVVLTDVFVDSRNAPIGLRSDLYVQTAEEIHGRTMMMMKPTCTAP